MLIKGKLNKWWTISSIKPSTTTPNLQKRCILLWRSSYQEGRVGIPSTGL